MVVPVVLLLLLLRRLLLHSSTIPYPYSAPVAMQLVPGLVPVLLTVVFP